MNVWYFKTQIPEELHGAKDYIKRAIEIREMHSPWAKELAEMSGAELEHASKLFKMFQEYYAKLSEGYKEMPKYIEEAHDELLNEYTNVSTEVKYLHEIFKQ